MIKALRTIILYVKHVEYCNYKVLQGVINSFRYLRNPSLLLSVLYVQVYFLIHRKGVCVPGHHHLIALGFVCYTYEYRNTTVCNTVYYKDVRKFTASAGPYFGLEKPTPRVKHACRCVRYNLDDRLTGDHT